MMKKLILLLVIFGIGFGVFAIEPTVGQKAKSAVTSSKIDIQRYDAMIAAFDAYVDNSAKQAQLDQLKRELHDISIQISRLKFQVEQQANPVEKQKFLDMLKQQVQAYKTKADELEKFSSQNPA